MATTIVTYSKFGKAVMGSVLVGVAPASPQQPAVWVADGDRYAPVRGWVSVDDRPKHRIWDCLLYPTFGVVAIWLRWHGVVAGEVESAIELSGDRGCVNVVRIDAGADEPGIDPPQQVTTGYLHIFRGHRSTPLDEFRVRDGTWVRRPG